MSKWIGVMISVNCKDDKGTYQGQIKKVTDKLMTLTKTFHNGVPLSQSEVKINTSDIEDLILIESQPESKNDQSIIKVVEPVAKRVGRSVSVSECMLSKSTTVHLSNSKSKHTESELKQYSMNSNIEYITYKNGTPNKKDKFKMKWKDEACFGESMDHAMLQDFDFEKNLALFNKEAIFKELSANQRPDIVHQTEHGRKQQVPKYRHDENVIATLPTMFRQITVPAPDSREYVTDDGLIIPSITQELRRQLLAAAEKRGLTSERQIELMGRAATEMALQLLGGGHRLNPHNTHQWPKVAVMCGPHRQGLVGMNCARQLASHGVVTTVFTAMRDPNGPLRSEFSLYKLTKNKVTTTVTGLPPSVDLIIVALCDDSDNPIPYTAAAEWIGQNRAPVLALDPPAVGTPGILAKFSLIPVLPLAHSPDNGKLYLCNLGFPFKVFKDVGIKYCSPFGPKFVIPLHPNDI